MSGWPLTLACPYILRVHSTSACNELEWNSDVFNHGPNRINLPCQLKKQANSVLKSKDYRLGQSLPKFKNIFFFFFSALKSEGNSQNGSHGDLKFPEAPPRQLITMTVGLSGICTSQVRCVICCYPWTWPRDKAFEVLLLVGGQAPWSSHHPAGPVAMTTVPELSEPMLGKDG